MLRLSDILPSLGAIEVRGFAEQVIERIAYHPEQVETAAGTLFVCMNEYLRYNAWQTWRTHLEWLGKTPVAAVVVPEYVAGLAMPQLIVNDPRRALGSVAQLLNGDPAAAGMALYGVTGTNGKTTTTRLIGHACTALGRPCGTIGTMGAELAGRAFAADAYTTPLAPQIYRCLREFRRAGATHAAMEVSSHGLALNRVEGLRFRAAVVTNLGRDHLDFHGTESAYREAKMRLLQAVEPDGFCLLNRSLSAFAGFVDAADGRTVLSYGFQGSGADLEGEIIPPTGDCGAQLRLYWQGETVALQPLLKGGFQMENLMAAALLLLADGVELTAIAEAVASFPPVCGRMEEILLPNGALAIVDYAHNPDGLRTLLDNCRPLSRGRLHLVFGCGGDRDRGKRPIMGKIAAERVDCCWITSDNPRSEDPQAIIQDVLAGVDGPASIYLEPDRRLAIQAAYQLTQPGELLVVAGKGHEDYQLIGSARLPFSDQAVLRGL